MSTSSSSSAMAAGDSYFQGILDAVLDKLRNNPGTITTEDARRLSENAVVGDRDTAMVISAVEDYAKANELRNEIDPDKGQPVRTSLLTIVQDLSIAVDCDPAGVTTEVLRSAQGIVSKMQKAIGHSTAPHPELESQLAREIAKIEPKVAQGTVTLEEANYLHSLEARAHGHTEKGGITAIAQSVAAKRERQMSLSSGSSASAATRSRASSVYTSSVATRSRASSVYTARAENEEGDGHEAEKSALTPEALPFVPQMREMALSEQTNVARKETSADVAVKISDAEAGKLEC